MNFDARQHLVTLNGKKRVPPKLLFEGEVLDYPDNPRISMIVGFPDSCTYILGQQTKWKRDKTNAEAQIRKEKVEAEQKVRHERKEEAKLERRLEEDLEPEERETTERVLSVQKEEVKEAITKVTEIKKEEYHAKRLRKRQATVFETGTRLHDQIRTKTRKELLEEKKVFLVEDINDWFEIKKKFSQGFTIVAPEFSLYILHKGLLITGHPDIWVLRPGGLLEVEEWKGSKTGRMEPVYHTQAILYSLALKELFVPKNISYTVRVWNKNDYPLEGKRLLTRIKTGETDVPSNSYTSHTASLDGVPKEITTILDFTYDLFTAQIPCTPVSSGLCKNWCPVRFKCPLFQEQKEFVKNFKVEV